MSVLSPCLLTKTKEKEVISSILLDKHLVFIIYMALRTYKLGRDNAWVHGVYILLKEADQGL